MGVLLFTDLHNRYKHSTHTDMLYIHIHIVYTNAVLFQTPI